MVEDVIYRCYARTKLRVVGISPRTRASDRVLNTTVGGPPRAENLFAAP